MLKRRKGMSCIPFHEVCKVSHLTGIWVVLFFCVSLSGPQHRGRVVKGMKQCCR